MATITSTSKSIFFGSPITISVSEGTAPQGAAFHRVMLDVDVSGHHFQLSRPADGGSLDFDISSCIKAVHEGFHYSPVTTSAVKFPVYTVSYSVSDVWVKDGKEETGGASSSNTGQYIAGAYSDIERISGVFPKSHSRKPLSGEIVCRGDRIVYTVSEGISPQSSPYNVTSTTSLGTTTIGGRSCFVIPADRRSQQFQFVNSRGCIESIHAFSLVSEKATLDKKETTYSIFERIQSMSRTFVQKSMKPVTFHLSSGFVNYRWAQWWAYEFCAANQHWMLHNGSWIPVHISMADTTVIDRSKVELLHVDFDVQPDLNGGLL